MAKKTTAAVPKKEKAPKKDPKPATTRSAFIAKAPIRRLMKNEGASLVAEDAVVLLIEKLTEVGKEVTKEAVKLVKADKRKRVTAADIIAAK